MWWCEIGFFFGRSIVEFPKGDRSCDCGRENIFTSDCKYIANGSGCKVAVVLTHPKIPIIIIHIILEEIRHHWVIKSAFHQLRHVIIHQFALSTSSLCATKAFQASITACDLQLMQ